MRRARKKSILMNEFIEVGYIVKAHGIRGEISIEYNADSPDLLWDSVYLAPPSAAEKAEKGMGLKRYALKKLRMHKERPLIILEGVPDRTAAELLRGLCIFIPESRLPELGEDEVYMSDLPGLTVQVRQEDGSLSRLGELSAAEEQAGQEIWTITTPDGKEVLFPATEDFVESIDLDAETVVITPPPGLLDLYLAEAEPKKAGRTGHAGRRRRKKHPQASEERQAPNPDNGPAMPDSHED